MVKIGRGKVVPFSGAMTVVDRATKMNKATGVILNPGPRKITMHHTGMDDAQSFYLPADPDFLRRLAETLVELADELT